jgi:hypothetical protein
MFQDLHELSEEDLGRIERLVEAASAGPWVSYVVGRESDASSNCIELGTCNELGSFKCIELTGGTVADQDFIASARQYLPRLVLEVRNLRAQLQRCALRGEGWRGVNLEREVSHAS